ncbi:MAG TPA: type II toxin-antitoxin system ParD family antitoxin [Cyanobacteria bacterium UBA12227]|nr:type II toxin-antitoxin system ParD family antitoxin [Cyanobacteria bacterium UBA12227]HAX86566.1 type II toxin-antitoxin system ParD family antitoxin [Cyanobacteria bacterium UBA11370]
MKVTLKPEQEMFIKAQIANGRFANADEVVDVAFRLLEKLSAEYSHWVEETRQKVDIAIAEIDREEILDGETFVDQLLDKFRQAREVRE